MSKYRKKQFVTVGILLVAIVGLSIGFSALSTLLNIETNIAVNPNKGELGVMFSSSETSLKTDSIKPITSSKVVDAKDAIIDNSGTPTIKNLSVALTSPGQSATYEFYAMNTGSVTAYLNSINFGEKKCEANIGTSQESVDLACSGIRVSIKFGSDITEYTGTTTLTGHPLPTNTVEKVTVTIMYAKDASEADGGFKVNYGTISVGYNAIDGGESSSPDTNVCENITEKSFGACTYKDNDSSGTITKGDNIICGTEEFIALSSPSNGRVTMITKYNLNVSTSGIEVYAGIDSSEKYPCAVEGYQDEHVRGGVNEYDPANLPYLRQYIFRYTNSGSGSGTGSIPSAEVVSKTSCAGSNFSGSGCQDEFVYIGYGIVLFYDIDATDGYWIDSADSTKLDSNFCTNGDCTLKYPLDVYDKVNSSSKRGTLTKTFIDSYAGKFNDLVSTAGATGRLLNLKDLTDFGCTIDQYGGFSCPNNLYSLTSFYTGVASASDTLYGFYLDKDGFDGSRYTPINSIEKYGIRPVLEINESIISSSN